MCLGAVFSLWPAGFSTSGESEIQKGVLGTHADTEDPGWVLQGAAPSPALGEIKYQHAPG